MTTASDLLTSIPLSFVNLCAIVGPGAARHKTPGTPGPGVGRGTASTRHGIPVAAATVVDALSGH